MFVHPKLKLLIFFSDFVSLLLVYLRGFFFDDKCICRKKREASDVLVRTVPFHTPAVPEFPLVQIEYPPASSKPERFIPC